MKNLILILFTTLTLNFSVKSQEPQAYRIYDAKGKNVSYSDMIKVLENKKVVFFGEAHNCPICHWLELEVTKSLFTKHTKNLHIGAEMFESDNQIILDEYLKGEISIKSFESEMRLWPNYQTDYVKLIDFAKENNISFAATNIPRRYASFVSQKGLKALSNISLSAKLYIAPLPIPYKIDSQKVKMFHKMTSMMGHSNRNPEFMNQAQAIKDATMGWNISKYMKNENAKFLHFNGSFHSDQYDGIIPFLNHYKPNLSIGTISCCRQDDVNKLEEINIGKADFVICIPNDMVNSY